ncbi:hypothetical protein NM208_g10090 [Fusarium decemcellulare]|uniref:Uncharacterized protein n=1 Tax=Fusarium decemcellulare TaxID=57161 RepID=A0ACC1RZ96_9HYPO|nr:hypothetical protein NM208_g10090 [Fusarium decemcellulare]
MGYTQETDGKQIARDLSSEIKGKTVLVTGASPSSLGTVFAKIVAEHSPALLILAGRNAEKTQETARSIAESTEVKVKILDLKLDSFAQVRKAAEQVNNWEDVDHIDVVVNNAGIMAVPFELTEDGVERQLATNFLGHFLFTNLIMGKVLRSKSPRIVNVSSNGHRFSPVRFDYNFQNGKAYDDWRAYGQSKTGNMLFSIALAEKLGSKGLVSASLHPGVIYTNLGAHLDWTGDDAAAMQAADVIMGTQPSLQSGISDFKSPEQGAATHVYTAFSPDIARDNGSYFLDSRLADPFEGEVYPWATDKAEAKRVWKFAEKLVGQEFKY